MELKRPHELTVVSGTPSALETAVTPPSRLMMSNAVMPSSYDIRSDDASPNTNISLDGCYDSVHSDVMLSKGELLAALVAKGVSNADIQKVLEMPSSRVSEILRATPGKETTLKPRELTYDEGVKLIRAFLPEQAQGVSPLPVPILRLLVLHVAQELNCHVPEEQLVEISEDLRAFAEYVSDPRVRGSAEASEAFFRALQLRRR